MAIAEQAELLQITLWTDSSSSYNRLGKQVARHEKVNHHAGQYVKRGAGTNKAENYFSQLKRSLDGTHHHVSKVHLQRYLNEFESSPSPDGKQIALVAKGISSSQWWRNGHAHIDET